MNTRDTPTLADPAWLASVKKAGWYAVAVAAGALVAEVANFADEIGKIYDRFKTPEAFVLAENSAKSVFSDQLAQRAWRRLFWADNFRARVMNAAPIADIDASWNAYIEADADWNAHLMIAIVGLERYYGAKRSADLEGKIQDLFSELDGALANLRRSEFLRALRAGNEATPLQRSAAQTQSDRAKELSSTLRAQLYTLVRCFARNNRATNLCN